MSVSMKLETRQFEQTLKRYAALRGKSDAEVVNKAMRYWLPFAGNKVAKGTPGGPAIRKELTGSPARVSRGAKKSQDALRNTLAAAIIGARQAKRGWKESKRDFYDSVRRLVNARARSANYGRAGFIPAYQAFGIRRQVAGHKRFKGRSLGRKAVPSTFRAAEAYVTNQRDAAYAAAPNAFRSSIPEVRRMFSKWIAEDLRKQAKKAGFY